MDDIEIALRNAHFRYRGSIEYRDTRAGIVIVVPISGIAQHYVGITDEIFKDTESKVRSRNNDHVNFG